jgi:hypothetical protein
LKRRRTPRQEVGHDNGAGWLKNAEGMMAVSLESGTGVRNLPIPGGITETEDLLLVPPAKFEG